MFYIGLMAMQGVDIYRQIMGVDGKVSRMSSLHGML